MKMYKCWVGTGGIYLSNVHDEITMIFMGNSDYLDLLHPTFPRHSSKCCVMCAILQIYLSILMLFHVFFC